MCPNAILSSLLLAAGAFGLAAMADDQSSPQKSSKSGSTTQSDQATPGTGPTGKGMMGKGMKGGEMMGKGMMGVPMIERGMKMMEMHQKMQEEMKAMDAESHKLLTEMNRTTGQKKIDAMAALLTQLVAQRTMMNAKMGAMYADMMQMMMEGMGGGTTHQPGANDKNGTAHEHSATSDNSEHAQHQH